MAPSSLCIVFIHQFGEFLLVIHQIFVNDVVSTNISPLTHKKGSYGFLHAVYRKDGGSFWVWKVQPM